MHNKMRAALVGLLTSILTLPALAQSWEPLYDGRVPGNLTDTVSETRTGPWKIPSYFDRS